MTNVRVNKSTKKGLPGEGILAGEGWRRSNHSKMKYEKKERTFNLTIKQTVQINPQQS